jgi:nitrate reductase gamma subunit
MMEPGVFSAMISRLKDRLGNKDVLYAAAWGSVTTLVLGLLIVLGSRNLDHFDAALVAYTFSVLFATFGITYRYAMWLRRPPTAMYWRRGLQSLVRKNSARQFGRGLKYFVSDVVANRFIWARHWLRGLTHLLIMWGCILGIVITFPLVFGWLMFQSVPGQVDQYQAFVFGIPLFSFAVDSVIGFLSFHGLVWASILVVAGVMLAMRRRMREEGAAALQSFVEDFMPLFLLFAVSVTGLMLTVSYTWMRGYAYDFLSLLHAIVVIYTLLWLPFGKFFHAFQRPAQLGVRLYKEAGREGEAAQCRRCGHAFTSRMHAEDLIEVERQLGFSYELDSGHGHYQWICPACRRSLLAQAQGRAWTGVRGGLVAAPGVSPEYVNPGLGLGPLGKEDSERFHA